ncbi:hypothetical protein GGQ84_001237 [Desulfitispora alkaliphila]|uniref:RNA methyltransferase n=1 Tax=Desulfitispora alkaliphila TaxID=622674 RepID=UPI003D25AE43
MSDKTPFYIALVHYPVYNKNMEVIATSITNLDIHDISRSACTYGVEKYYLVHPNENQQKVTRNIIEYWQQGFGSKYNTDRKRAFSAISLKNSLEEVKKEIKDVHGLEPKVIATDARIYPNSLAYQEMKAMIKADEHPYLLLFGTGWGLEAKELEAADYFLEPIYGTGDYNHLSVRAAAAIILDRLFGR